MLPIHYHYMYYTEEFLMGEIDWEDKEGIFIEKINRYFIHFFHIKMGLHKSNHFPYNCSIQIIGNRKDE